MSRADLSEALRGADARTSESQRRNRTRNLLVIGEVALTLALLVGAGLLLRSFIRLTQLDPGFNPDNVVTMKIALSGGQRFGGSQQQAAFFRQVLERVMTVPGVQSVGAVSHLPLSGSEEIDDFVVEGMPSQEPSKTPVADLRSISPDYFHAMGIGLIKGRFFTEQDHQNARKVAIISESLARRFWPNEDPLGKRLNRGDANRESDWLTVVGVVEDVSHSALELPSRPHLYQSYLQLPWSYMTLVVRTKADSAGVISALRREVWSVDKNQPVTDIKRMRDYLAEAVTVRRFNMQLVAIFALLALLLSAIGLYGVMAYSIAQRTREIGIRMAFGAEARDILKLVVGQGMKLALMGIVIGLMTSFALTRLMRTLLFGISATDPLTFIMIALLLIMVALLACWIPARRATKVDPMAALRAE